MQNEKKTKICFLANRTTFNAHWPINLINNAEAKEKKGLRPQTKKTDIRPEAIVTIYSCMSLNEQEYHNMI